uniref:Vacuolar protein 14 C-terminal Fig4-binding domain-containing protein n=1 Tax=Glossina austeni TaxID=7395 RepID=A0A1A9V0R9_GLOAU
MEQIDLKSIMTVLARYLSRNSGSTHLNVLGNNLLSILSDNSDDIVLKCISVLHSIQKLCVLLNAEYIYLTFSGIIAEEVINLKFASLIVGLLNSILLTSSELFELRSVLRDIHNENSAKLFNKRSTNKANNCGDAQYLAHALFGVLMLLPQTDAFCILNNRLNEKQSLQYKSNIDFIELKLHFKKIQKAHRDQRVQHRKRSFLVNEH